MKKLAASLILGCANLALLCISSSRYWTHLMFDLPTRSSIAPLAIWFAVPLLGLATVGFAIRDFLRTNARWQPAIALGLFIPVAIAYWPPW